MTKQSVIIGLSGGLGNQLFQYSAGRSLSLSLDCDLSIDYSWFLAGYNRKYSLDTFNLPFGILGDSRILPVKLDVIRTRVAKKFLNTRFGLPIYREPHFHFDQEFKLIKSPVFLDGHFQSERYFREYQEIIRSDLCLIDPFPDRCFSVISDIKVFDAIAVHVRRGDYLSSKKNFLIYNQISLKYYIEAVKVISDGLKNPKCFIFSDDISWAKEHLKFDVPMNFVDANPNDEAYWDLRLMSACNHFVIANSSFSWWGAWLGVYPYKKVVAPKHWFKSKIKDTVDLLPNNWIQL